MVIGSEGRNGKKTDREQKQLMEIASKKWEKKKENNMVDLLANNHVEMIFLCAAAYHFLAEDVALNLQIANSFLVAGYKTVKLRMVEERSKPDPYEDSWLFLLAITELWKNK